MGTSGTRGWDSRLECPDCGSKVVWDGSQHLCSKCPWKEHVAKPPSDRKIPVPDKKPKTKKRVREEEE